MRGQAWAIWTKLLAAVLLIVFLSVQQATANTPDMSRDEVSGIIRKNSQLNEEQIKQLVDALAEQLNVAPEQRIPIRGVLYTHGLNGAFFVDTDTWFMDATVVDPKTNQLVEINDLFMVTFYNGGLKFELAYKWMFTFVPSNMTVQQLDGGIFGRGIGATMEAFLGLEGAWMPGENRPGHLFHAAIKAGFGAGLNFPEMEFKLRPIR